MNPTPADLAAYLTLAAQALGEQAARVERASASVRASGQVRPEDFLVLAEAEGSRLRAPASALLMAAEILSARPPDAGPVGLLGSWLVLHAQVLRREADRLRVIRADGDLAVLVDAVRASLMEQASLALMMATWLEVRQAEKKLA